MEQDAPVFFNTPYPDLNAILEQVYRHRGADGQGSLRQLSEAVDKLVEKWAAASAPADSVTAPAGPDRWREMLQELEWACGGYNRYGDGEDICPCCENWKSDGHKADCRLAELLATTTPPAQAADSVLEDAAQQPRLKVRITAFPESNGKQNWTALLVRADKWDGLVGNCGGISLARGELWNRVAYEAECARFLIGERDTEPFILDYGDDIKTPEEWKGEVHGGRKPRDAARKQGANHD